MNSSPTNNILKFPKERVIRETEEPSEVQQVKQKGMKAYADSVARQVSTTMLEELSTHGLEITSNTFVKDFYSIVAVLHASIYRSFGFDHPIQKWIDSNEVVVDKAIVEPNEPEN